MVPWRPRDYEDDRIHWRAERQRHKGADRADPRFRTDRRAETAAEPAPLPANPSPPGGPTGWWEP